LYWQLTVGSWQLTIKSIEIFNAFGEKVIIIQPPVSSSSSQTSISGLPASVYFVQVQTEKVITMEKLIIQ